MNAQPSAAAAGTIDIGGDLTVNRLGFGAMRITGPGIWGEPPSRDQAIATLRRVVELGVNFIDTADSYGPAVSETLIAEALQPYPDDLVIATKGGLTRTGPGQWPADGRPEHLREALEGSLQRLRLDQIPLYQFHRPDPKVPYAESVGVLKELLDAGKIRLAGISNASVEQIDIARRVLGEGNLASVQNQFSPAFRSSEPELRHTADLGIAFLPWSPLGGIGNAGELGSRHAAFAEIAQDRGVSPQRLTLAWMLALAPTVIPIPGASRPESVTDSAQAADLTLTSEEVARLSKS